MNVRIESDFRFSVSSIQYTPQGELCITLASGDSPSATRYQYTANLGSWQAEETPAGYTYLLKSLFCHVKNCSYLCNL